MSRFHRTIFLVEVLTDDGPYNPDSLEQIHRDIIDGPYSGTIKTTSSISISSKTMATLLKSQGSDPEFFNLTDEGEDLDDGTLTHPISADDRPWLIIKYAHYDCKVDPTVKWTDEWYCACNGECPACGMKDIEPVGWEEKTPQNT